MNYTTKAYNKALKELSKRRQASLEENKCRQSYVYAQLPEVRAMQESRQNTRYELMKIIAVHDPNASESASKVKENNISTAQRIKLLVKDLTGDENYLEPTYVCNECKDNGYKEGMMCDCLRDLIKRFMVEELNEGSTIALHDFSEFCEDFYDNPDTRNRMIGYKIYFERYCDHFPTGSRSMLFMGKTGLGKTFFSSCIAKSLGERGFTVAFDSAPDLFRHIEDEHFGRSEGNTLDTLLDVDMLILDDLASEFQSQFYESALYNILNGRINLKKPTIISTNLTKSEFYSRYNERITSRVLYQFVPFQFDGKDIRMVKSVSKISKKVK